VNTPAVAGTYTVKIVVGHAYNEGDLIDKFNNGIAEILDIGTLSVSD
jgi:hypothetical protein